MHISKGIQADVTYGDIVADDSWQGSILCVVLCHMYHNIVLNVAVLSNLDAVHIPCKCKLLLISV